MAGLDPTIHRVILSEEEFAAFDATMRTPATPAPEMIEAAKLHALLITERNLRAALQEALSAMEAFDGEGFTSFFSAIDAAKAALNK